MFPLNFNGSGGVLRAAALREAGGWQADTLCEDLDASYRLQMEGYRILYLRDIAIPGEVPPTVPGFCRQQARWACGSLRTARKLLPRMIADPGIDGLRRVQGFIHLTGYLVHPLMLLSFLLTAAATFLGVTTPWVDPIGAIGAIAWIAIAACTVAVWMYPLTALRVRGRSIVRNLPSILVLGLLGFGISPGNTIEAIKALLSRRAWTFRRTPKYGVRRRGDDWRGKRYQVPRDVVSLLDIALALVGIAAAGLAFARGSFARIPLLLVYTASFSFVAIMSCREARRGRGGDHARAGGDDRAQHRA